ncbi:putative ATP-binding cassette transporter [Hyaloscypha variabilis F]|uniref:Putative ATP-binding cassette transporter n=1 Tax=Hyaloscypha variabilis (strain UAMH 11265 / GT02V1 / F) TaxID=1149755 RepID=A0A2J6SDJ3_HYAVF|nr:putative ATP-binding cassette transporter [Hyaloscypha variabilis F]
MVPHLETPPSEALAGDDVPTWPAVYSLFIASSFLLFSAVRGWQLRETSVKLKPASSSPVKLVTTIAFLAVQLSSFVKNSSAVFDIHVLSNAISSLAALVFCILSFIEHQRSPTPSTLLVLYILACLLGSGVELLILPPSFTVGSISLPITNICVELAVLVFECQKKDSAFLAPYQQLTLEERAGILERTFFLWINPILKRGYRLNLTDADLPRAGKELSSEGLRRKILRTWDQRAKPERTTTLPYVLLKCFKGPVAAAILPRLFLIVFRYSQPVLINISVRYIDNARKESGSTEEGRWLIVGALVVYVGLAVSKATYQHQLNRLEVMIRGALVSLVYQRSLHVKNADYEDGSAVTLMSTDVDNVQDVGQMFHETWAQVLEVIIGTSLLATQIGWMWPIPLIMIVFCTRVSRYVASNLNRKQRDWSVATQKRISMTVSMLASAKSIKMLGISKVIQTKVQSLRVHEMAMSKRLRWMMVVYNASANALGLFAPPFTIVVFAIVSRSRGHQRLDASTAFTTIALMTFISHPANMLMTIYPRAVACMANFERIQRYLLESSQEDNRADIKIITPEVGGSEFEEDTSSNALVGSKISVQYPSNTTPILQDINFQVKAGSFWIFSGRVGSGKTTLAGAILGEVPLSFGSLTLSTKRIGFCPQTPWLPSSSVRDIICEEGDHDPEWYKDVIHACGLEQDLDTFPHGDHTQIGSRGIKLSGGQRQRVALARAVYARCDILVLDEPFSALDGATENHVVQNLLGPTGMLRQNDITVILMTSNVQHYALADRIVILGDSRIQLEGAPDDVLHSSSQILKTILHDKEKANRQLDEPKTQQIPKSSSTDTAALNLTRRTGDLALYGYYLKSVGVLNFIGLLCFTSSYSFFFHFSQYWVKWWTESESDQTWFYVGGYLIFAFMAWTTTNGLMWSQIIKIAPHSGTVIHYSLLKSIIGAPLSFYSKSEIGTLLNRFSQDIQFVDKKLPPSLSGFVVQAFKITMQIILLLISQRRILVTLPFCVITVYFVQKIYLRTSRQLRFLELESRSAVYSSFLETVDGITTIRAFGWQNKFSSRNIIELDISQSPFYLLMCLQRWLNIVLDLLVTGIAVSVISVSVVFRGTMTGGQLGVALNMILLVNTTLLSLVALYTNLEISLGAIARLKETIQETPQESGPEEKGTIQGWPSAGAVNVQGLEVSYIPGKLALCDINLKIEAGQRLILCGRTGSGKSTFVLSLLRLLDPSSGSITVDGINISDIPRSTVRQKCFISVPQDPFLLADATLRFNVDPNEHYSDEEIVVALKKAQLWSQFSRTEQNGHQTSSTDPQPTAPNVSEILESTLSALPQLSTGQQQLLSLARAVLRAQPPALTIPYTDQISAPTQIKPILVLDEATSSLDEETEAMIYDIIQQEFTDKGHTVIAISHRLGALKKGWEKGRDVLVRIVDGRVEWVGDLGDVIDGEVEGEEGVGGKIREIEGAGGEDEGQSADE